MTLESRVAIVTGAGGGLGRAHALLLARHGAKVVVNDMDQSAAARVADEIVAAGGDAIAVAASVTDEAAVPMPASKSSRIGRRSAIAPTKSFRPMASSNRNASWQAPDTRCRL